MKKFLLIIIAVILACIALSSIGHIMGLAISSLIVYYSLKQFFKSASTWQKIAWILIGMIGFSGLMANLPAIAGIAALYILYVGYKNWKKEKAEVEVNSNDHDSFANFERQWNELNNSNK